ncbi:MAG: ABC transporter permease [Nitrososphaerota archaeon]
MLKRLALVFMLFLQIAASVYASDSSQDSGSIVFTVTHDGFEPVRDGLKFILLTPSEEEISLETRGGKLVCPLVLGGRLVGPVIEDGEGYLPVNIPIDLRMNPGSTRLLVLERAFLVKFVELYPWIDGRPISVDYELELYSVSGNYSKTIVWSHSVDRVLRLVGLDDGEALVPLSTGFKLYAAFEVDGGGPRWAEDVTISVKDASSISLLRWIYLRALVTTEDKAREIGSNLENLAQSGIYLGYQSSRLEKANQMIQSSKDESGAGRFPEAYRYLRRAYSELEGIESVLSDYASRGAFSGVSLPLYLILGALATSHLVMGDRRRSIVGGMLLLSIVTFIFVAVSYPPLLPGDAWGWSALLYSALVLLGLVYGIPLLGIEVKTYRGVALLSAIYLAFSTSVRFLKTRPLRSWLMIAMSTITVAAALLLVNTGVAGDVFVSNPLERVSPPGTAYVVAYSRDYRYDSLAAVEAGYVPFISSFGPDFGLRAETPIFPPGGREYTVNYRDYYLRGVIGIYGDPPFKTQLENCIIAGRVSNLGKKPAFSLVSQDLAENLGLTVGSRLSVNGVALTVEGILSLDCPTYLKDVDGYFVSTLVEPPMSPVTPAGWSNIIVTGFEEALRLGAIPTKIYSKMSSDEEAYRVGELMALHTDLKVRVITSGGEVFVFNFVRLAGITGGEVIVVAGIAFLNLLVASLANYYERRGEFFTMSTLGLNPGHIVLLASAEALILAVISSYAGILLTLGVLGIAPRLAEVPIDFKLTQPNILGVLALSAIIFVAAHVLSVRKSVILSTPSQTWKWTLDKAIDEEGYWRVELPARVRASRMQHFISYMSSRLAEYSYTTTVNISVLGTEEGEGGIHRLRFIYSSTEQRSFRANCILEVVRNGEWCSTALRARIEAQDERFIDQYLREVAQLMRQLIMEYTSLTVRILVPLGRDYSYLLHLITNYNPSEVRIVWRGTSEESLQRAVQLLEDFRVRSVVIRLSPTISVTTDGKSMLDAAKNCDLISISSDDGYLSSLALLVAQRLGKRVCIVGESGVAEASPESLWEQIR